MSAVNSVQAVNQLRQTKIFGCWITRYDEKIAHDMDQYRARLDDNLGDGPPLTRAKAVKDALWGMIDFDWPELVVLDSPPLQRLRRVKQLGFTHLTYPTAGYSRFEHVLGAMFQSERLLRSVERRSDPELRQFIVDAIPIARLAALLHDVGHLPASHLGERYYSEAECEDPAILDDIQGALADIAKALNVPKPALGEALSLAVVLSPNMWGLMTERARYKPEQVAAAALAIVGAPPSTQQAFLPNVITNVIDADKLDYLFRDALVTQIPLAVDLDRLLYKLKVVQVPASEMEESLQSMASAGGTCNVLGTDLAGFDLLYDLLASRSMLFDRIYLHHKTRAAERVALDIMAEAGLHPIDMLAFDDEVFSTPVIVDTAITKDRRRRLRQRELPRRAYAMSYAFLPRQVSIAVGESPRVDDEDQAAFDELAVNALGDKAGRDNLLRLITEKREWIASILSINLPLPELWLDNRPGSHHLGDPDLFVQLPDGRVEKEDSYPQKASAVTRSPLRAAYLYGAGSNEAVQLAFVAAEIVIAEQHRLYFSRRAADHAKVNFEGVQRLKRRIEEASPSVFDSLGRLRPTSALAATEFGRTRISALAGRFHAFNVGDAPGAPSMSEHRVHEFLDQFPESLVRPMLDVLDGVTFLTRDDLGAGLVRSLGDGSGLLAAFPFTSDPEKSAATLGSYFADASPRPRLFRDVTEAIASVRNGETSELASVDDFCLSGLQAGTVVQIMMGLSPLLLPEEDGLTNPLSDADRELLRQTPIKFRFVFATPEGMDRLREVCAGAGFTNFDIDSVLKPGDVADFDAVAGSHAAELTDFLARVGKELLAATKGRDNPQKWTDKRIGDSALGYGNAKLLVVHHNNCPAATMTALWSPGTFRGIPWKPLFVRRSSDQ